MNTRLLKVLPIMGIFLLIMANLVSVVQGHFTTLTWVVSLIGALFFLLIFIRGELANVRLYIHIALYTAIGTGILVLLYLFALNHPVKVDFTKHKNFSLSPQSAKYLKALEDEISVYSFTTTDVPGLKNFLENYQLASDKLTVRMLNPLKDHALTKALSARLGSDLYEGTLLVENRSNHKLKKVDRAREEDLTNAIIAVTREVEMVAYFLKGHGEKPLERDFNNPDPQERENCYSEVKRILEERAFRTEALELATKGFVPEDCSILICAGPRTDLFAAEADLLNEYLAAGGRALFALDPPEDFQYSFPNFTRLLAKFDMVIKDDVIIDPVAQSITGDWLSPLVSEFKQDHPMTRDVPAALMFVPGARSVFPSDDPTTGALVETVMSTSESSWSENLDDLMKKFDGEIAPSSEDDVKPQSLAVAYSKKSTSDPGKEIRIFTIGDSDIFTDLNITTPMTYPLLLNTINWVTAQEDLLAIPPKRFDETPLVLSRATISLLRVILVITIPSLIFFGGLGYTLLRRKTR